LVGRSAAEELAIWATVGVTLFVVAVMIWRGELTPTTETHHECAVVAHGEFLKNRPPSRLTPVCAEKIIRIDLVTE